MEWISVKDKMPGNGVHVLLCCEIRPIKKRYVCDGFYIAEKTMKSLPDDDDEIIEYDEAEDAYFRLEGYYEVIKNWEDYGCVVVGDFVTHWMPLPDAPK